MRSSSCASQLQLKEMPRPHLRPMQLAQLLPMHMAQLLPMRRLAPRRPWPQKSPTIQAEVIDNEELEVIDR